ncbi:MAG: dTMP kinase [Clostridiales bacterium]|nr:dTMP kinase [Clostridiales bacterium]
MAKGKFIVFEGIDGSGKSTQIKLLYKYLTLKGIPCYTTFEPTDSPFGSLIRQCLSGRIETDDKTIAGLFVADRLDHLYNAKCGLIEKINSGVTVLCDRYYLSSYAYHGAFMDMNWVIDANRLSAEALKPDVNIFIDVAPEVTIERIKARGASDRYEKLESMKKIRQKYFEAFELLKDTERVEIVKGADDIKVTEKRIREVADKIFGF